MCMCCARAHACACACACAGTARMHNITGSFLRSSLSCLCGAGGSAPCFQGGAPHSKDTPPPRGVNFLLGGSDPPP